MQETVKSNEPGILLNQECKVLKDCMHYFLSLFQTSLCQTQVTKSCNYYWITNCLALNQIQIIITTEILN